MSDSDTGTDEAAAPSEVNSGSPISILHQYTKDLSFENPGAPQVFVQEAAAPEVSINVDVNVAQLGERDHEVSLQLNALAKTADTTLFMAELVYCGLVRIGDVPEEHVQPLLMIEAPRLLFPYARNIISDTTRDGGFPALMVGHVDFVELFRRRLEGLKEAADAATAAKDAPEPAAT